VRFSHVQVVTRKLWENPAREPPGGPPPCVWATLEQVQPQGQEMGGMASLAGMAGLGGMGGGVGMGMMGVGSSPMMGIGGGGGLMAMQPMQVRLLFCLLGAWSILNRGHMYMFICIFYDHSPS
jgi:hypothetical protein